MSEKREYNPPTIEEKGEMSIPEVLTKHYKADCIHTQHVEAVNERTIKSYFIFPEYKRTIESLGHVSMAQMHEGLLESLTSCLQNAFESEPDSFPLTTDAYLEQANNAIYKYESLVFTEMKRAGEMAILETTLTSVVDSDSGRFKKATFQIDGFMKGEVVCLLPNS